MWARSDITNKRQYKAAGLFFRAANLVQVEMCRLLSMSFSGSGGISNFLKAIKSIEIYLSSISFGNQ